MSDENSQSQPEAGSEPGELSSVEQGLQTLNGLVFGEGSKVRFEYVEIATLKEQDLNANVMAPEMFKQLVANIRNSGVVESVPLCATRVGSDVREVVSGHHRIRAAAEAGKTHLVAIVCRDLTDAEIKAKQLAHNSIQGTSDAQIVAQIFAQIDSIPLQIESFINPNALRVPDPVAFGPADVDLLANSKTVTLVFLPTQATNFDRALELLAQSPDTVYVAHAECFNHFKAAVTRTRRDLDVRAIPSAVTEMARIVLDHLDALEPEGRTKEWVRLIDVMKTTHLPPDVAERITQALAIEASKPGAEGHTQEPWQLIDAWARREIEGAS